MTRLWFFFLESFVKISIVYPTRNFYFYRHFACLSRCQKLCWQKAHVDGKVNCRYARCSLHSWTWNRISSKPSPSHPLASFYFSTSPLHPFLFLHEQFVTLTNIAKWSRATMSRTRINVFDFFDTILTEGLLFCFFLLRFPRLLNDSFCFFFLMHFHLNLYSLPFSMFIKIYNSFKSFRIHLEIGFMSEKNWGSKFYAELWAFFFCW